jgi:hypothetical protein
MGRGTRGRVELRLRVGFEVVRCACCRTGWAYEDEPPRTESSHANGWYCCLYTCGCIVDVEANDSVLAREDRPGVSGSSPHESDEREER